MTTTTDIALRRIVMQEWQGRGPADDHVLRDMTLNDAESRATARVLNERGMLKFTELRSGLALRSTSYVGQVRVGPLEITVRPKIGWDGLLRLARYAYGIRAQAVGPKSDVALESDSLADLLIVQLCGEARTIASRGRHRRYHTKRMELATPRGRLDTPRLARQHASGRPGLPCVVRSRSEDVLLNQMVLAGLRMGARVAASPEVRETAARAAAVWADEVGAARLDSSSLQRVVRELDRMTEHYRPALRLVDALLAGSGMSLNGKLRRVPLPGFLFDMNRFFQHFLSKFLHEFLDGYTVRDEHVLQFMLSYAAGANPRRRVAPTPRPDFAIQLVGETKALLDAKYRDLWETKLPREMLYQLTTYALSQPEGFESAILYPCLSHPADVQRVEIKNPTSGRVRATVALRPVPLLQLGELLTGPSTAASRALCRELARRLALG